MLRFILLLVMGSHLFMNWISAQAAAQGSAKKHTRENVPAETGNMECVLPGTWREQPHAQAYCPPDRSWLRDRRSAAMLALTC